MTLKISCSSPTNNFRSVVDITLFRFIFSLLYCLTTTSTMPSPKKPAHKKPAHKKPAKKQAKKPGKLAKAWASPAGKAFKAAIHIHGMNAKAWATPAGVAFKAHLKK